MTMTLIEHIRGLSSGTIATVMRQSRLTEPYKTHDAWIVDRYHDRFRRFVLLNPDNDWGTNWMEAWDAYVKELNLVCKSWKSSYQGATSYEMRGFHWEVRSHAEDDGHYNGDYYETGIEPVCGCVYLRSDVCKFPPEWISVCFPCYTPSRWDSAAWTVSLDSDEWGERRVIRQQYESGHVGRGIVAYGRGTCLDHKQAEDANPAEWHEYMNQYETHRRLYPTVESYLAVAAP
jgi:hypothetical protein